MLVELGIFSIKKKSLDISAGWWNRAESVSKPESGGQGNDDNRSNAQHLLNAYRD
jgi:hypothetical protein